MSLERDTVSAAELFLALDESARFLTLCGINASVVKNTDTDFSYAQATALYDSFEVIAESLLSCANNLLITLLDDSLRFITDCDSMPPLPPARSDISVTCEDGQLFICVTLGKGAQI